MLAAYPSILCCLRVAAGIEHNILAVTSPKPTRTESTWMGFPSTLLLQLFFVQKIKDRMRTEDAGLMLRSVFFCLALTLAFCIFVRVLEMPSVCLCESSISVFSASDRGSVLAVHGCAHTHTHTHTTHASTHCACDICEHKHPHSCTHLHTHTRTHVRTHTPPVLLECNHGNGAPAQ